MKSPRLLVIEAIAVISGAVMGSLAYIFVAWLIADVMPFASVAFEGIVVALVTVAIFAVYYHYMAQTPAALASFFTGIAIPGLVIALSPGTSLTTTSLILCIVFSLVALLVYRFVLANSRVRQAVASNVEGPGQPGL